jgi:hypothetical protein
MSMGISLKHRSMVRQRPQVSISRPKVSGAKPWFMAAEGLFRGHAREPREQTRKED